MIQEKPDRGDQVGAQDLWRCQNGARPNHKHHLSLSESDRLRLLLMIWGGQLRLGHRLASQFPVAHPLHPLKEASCIVEDGGITSQHSPA